MRGSPRLRAATVGLAVAWGVAVAGPAAQRRATVVAVFVLLGLSMTVTSGWLRTAALHAPAAVALGGAAASLVLGNGQVLPLALVGAAAAGAAVSTLPVLPASRAHRIVVPLLTLGVSSAVWWLALPALRLAAPPPPVLLGFDLGGGGELLVAAVLLAGGMWALVGNVSASSFGRRVRVLGADRSYAARSGVPVARAWAAMFALSGAAAGLAGAVLAVLAGGLPDPATTRPGFAVTVLGITALGGAVRPAGAVVGGLVLGLLPAAVPGVPDLRLVVAAAAIAATALVPGARGGLVGAAERALAWLRGGGG